MRRGFVVVVVAALCAAGVLGAIIADWGSYDAQTQAALTPYFVRPNDPGSVFARPARRAARRTGLDGPPRPGGVVAVGPAANGRILVWGQSTTDPQALAVINILGSGADNVLAPIEKLMGR